MKIYYYSNNRDTKDASEIFSYLRKVGVDTIDGNDHKHNLSANNEDLVSKVDFLLVHGLPLNQQATYLMAFALANNKDVFCLFPEGKSVDKDFQNLQNNRNFSRKIKIYYYQNNIVDIIASYLENYTDSSAGDVVNIKYTLRISRRINDYLNWKAEAKGIKKADWLRDQINLLMASDNDYLEFKKNKYRK